MDYLARLKENEEFEYWLGADKEQILYVEKELNIKLPKQYKFFYPNVVCAILVMLVYLE